MNRVTLAALAVLPVIAAGLGGCPKGPDPDPCTIGFIGDKAQAPTLEAWVIATDGGKTPALADGVMVPITEPPQGGRVIFVGVRARNVDGCGAQLKGVLRNLETRGVTLDDRTVNLTTAGESTIDDFSSLANISVCENNWSASNIYGHTYELDMTVTDRGGRVAQTKVKVVPFCAEPANLGECLCICSNNYRGSCPNDGGVPDAS